MKAAEWGPTTGPGSGLAILSLAGVPLESSLVMDTVELDASTDADLPQPLQGLLVQAGGPQRLSIECQLQPSLLAQEQHLVRRA